jgi:hypothetical protein
MENESIDYLNNKIDTLIRLVAENTRTTRRQAHSLVILTKRIDEFEDRTIRELEDFYQRSLVIASRHKFNDIEAIKQDFLVLLDTVSQLSEVIDKKNPPRSDREDVAQEP